MRALSTIVVLVAAVTVAIAAVGVPATPAVERDARFEQAYAAAVKYRAQRDYVQRLLTRRVLENRGLRRSLVHRPSSLEALRLAAIVYGLDFHLLYRRASCESTGSRPASPASERTLNAHAKNPHSDATGLMQIMYRPDGRGDTWHTTPFAREDPFSPYANALAAAWMIGEAGRGGEWVCR